MKQRDIVTKVFEFDSEKELDAPEQELVKAAKLAALNAYAPYSHFQVGAALRLANGIIIKGNNQENAAYPSGLCAERVAMFYANAEYPNVAVDALVVTVISNGKFLEQPAPPCGSCRQVLLETETRFNHPIKIYLVAENKIDMVENAHALLPVNFDASFLTKLD
jgi:cytidine deaminase